MTASNTARFIAAGIFPDLCYYDFFRGIQIIDDLKADSARESFLGLENYEMFLKAKPKLVQCTSCSAICLARLTKDDIALLVDNGQHELLSHLPASCTGSMILFKG